jgi:hypothetical protein
MALKFQYLYREHQTYGAAAGAIRRATGAI